MISLYIGHRLRIVIDGIALTILGLHDVVEDAIGYTPFVWGTSDCVFALFAYDVLWKVDDIPDDWGLCFHSGIGLILDYDVLLEVIDVIVCCSTIDVGAGDVLRGALTSLIVIYWINDDILMPSLIDGLPNYLSWSLVLAHILTSDDHVEFILLLWLVVVTILVFDHDGYLSIKVLGVVLLISQILLLYLVLAVHHEVLVYDSKPAAATVELDVVSCEPHLGVVQGLLLCLWKLLLILWWLHQYSIMNWNIGLMSDVYAFLIMSLHVRFRPNFPIVLCFLRSKIEMLIQ
jgi:hypothetical protein